MDLAITLEGLFSPGKKKKSVLQRLLEHKATILGSTIMQGDEIINDIIRAETINRDKSITEIIVN